MYKIDPKYHLSIRKKLPILHKVYDKIYACVKTIYLPDAIAIMSSMLTDILPRTGKHITNGLVASVCNILTLKLLQKRDMHIAAKVRNPKKILVISDLNIGDAVNLQCVILAIKRFFPESKADYAVNAKAYNLVACNPYVDGVFNILSYDICASEKAVSYLIDSENYDFIVNLCPFFKKSYIIGDQKLSYLDYRSLSARLIYNELYSNSINHVAYQAYGYFSDLFFGTKNIDNLKRKVDFVPSIYLPDQSIKRARRFLQENGLTHKRLILFNPDATSIYTQLPFDIQLDILKSLCESDSVQAVLLTSGHTYSGIENRLLGALPNHNKVIVIPKEMPIDIYAALIDCCDLFVTADTGTMHIAAAKKFDQNGNALRNNTAIFSIFGATSARMYGYSSADEGFFNPGQENYAKLYISSASCRNITCINKKAKRCKNIRCFNGIDGSEIAKDIIEYLLYSKSK